MKKLLFGTLFASMAFGANMASAQNYPGSVVGNWSVLGNQSPGTLNITSQGSSGNCRPITGFIYGNNPIQGFYCPVTGRIQFLRKFPPSNVVGQVWTGNLSNVGSLLHMGGAVSSPVAVPFGEFNFQAQFPMITSPTPSN